MRNDVEGERGEKGEKELRARKKKESRITEICLLH